MRALRHLRPVHLWALHLGLLAITGPVGARQIPTIGFDQTSYTFDEDVGTAFAQVRLTHCGARRPLGNVQVRISATDGTAVEGEDFFVFEHGSIGTVDKGAGANPRVFRSLEVPLNFVHDDVLEPTENFQLVIELLGDPKLDCGNGAEGVALGPAASV